MWKSDLSDKIKQEIFQTVSMSALLYGCTTGTLMKCLEKKIETTQGCFKQILETAPHKTTLI